MICDALVTDFLILALILDLYLVTKLGRFVDFWVILKRNFKKFNWPLFSSFLVLKKCHKDDDLGHGVCHFSHWHTFLIINLPPNYKPFYLTGTKMLQPLERAFFSARGYLTPRRRRTVGVDSTRRQRRLAASVRTHNRPRPNCLHTPPASEGGQLAGLTRIKLVLSDQFFFLYRSN